MDYQIVKPAQVKNVLMKAISEKIGWEPILVPSEDRDIKYTIHIPFDSISQNDKCRYDGKVSMFHLKKPITSFMDSIGAEWYGWDEVGVIFIMFIKGDQAC